MQEAEDVEQRLRVLLETTQSKHLTLTRTTKCW